MNETRKVFGPSVAEKLQAFFDGYGFNVFTNPLSKNTIPMVRFFMGNLHLSHSTLKISNIGDQQLFDLHDGYLRCLHDTQALKKNDDFGILKDQQELAWKAMMSWIKKQSKANPPPNKSWVEPNALSSISNTPDWLREDYSFDENSVFGSSERIPKALDEVCLEISLMLDIIPALWPIEVQKEYNIDLIRFCKRSIDIYYQEALEQLLKGLVGDIEAEINDRSKLAKAESEKLRLNQYVDELVGLQKEAIKKKDIQLALVILQVLENAPSEVSNLIVLSAFVADHDKIMQEWSSMAGKAPGEQINWLLTFIPTEPKE